jgi:hypothetical protein
MEILAKDFHDFEVPNYLEVPMKTLLQTAGIS